MWLHIYLTHFHRLEASLGNEAAQQTRGRETAFILHSVSPVRVTHYPRDFISLSLYSHLSTIISTIVLFSRALFSTFASIFLPGFFKCIAVVDKGLCFQYKPIWQQYIMDHIIASTIIQKCRATYWMMNHVQITCLINSFFIMVYLYPILWVWYTVNC